MAAVVDAITDWCSQVHSEGGIDQSKARICIVPLSKGRFARLRATFLASTESMTSGRSVARTSQPKEQRARLRKA